MTRLVMMVAGCLMLATIATAAPPELSDLTLLPGDRLIGPAAGTQEHPAIAAGANGYLVVWADQRDARTPLAAFLGGPYLTPGVGTMRDIYAVRLDSGGNLIDLMPIPISIGILNQGFPSVAWNGQNWLVVWQHQSGLSCCPTSDIRGARVSPGGVVLDAQPIAIDLAQGQNLERPIVGSDGTNWLVVWRDWDMPAGIATLDGARVSPAGVVLDPGGVHLRRDSWNSYPTNAALAFAGDEYLLAWIEGSGSLKGQRFTAALAKIDASPFPINLNSPSIAAATSVATDGNEFLVTWFENRYYGWAQLFGARVSHAGVVRDPAGIQITGYAGSTQFAPATAWSGSNWIVAYNLQPSGSLIDDLYATRISAAGAVLDAAGRAIKTGPGYQSNAAIAWAGGGARIVWMDTRAGGPFPEDIYSASISATGTVGTEACVSLGAPAQVAPDFVWNGDHFLAVFASLTSGTTRIVGQRFDASGSPLDAQPFTVASGPSLGAPAVAWDGTRYLVVWSDVSQSEIYGRRMRPDGSAIDGAPLLLMAGDEPDVAALGDVFLVVATDAPQHPHFRHPFALRVRGSDGVALDPSPVVIGGYFAKRPSVGAMADRWLIAWEYAVSHDNPRADVAANFVERSGAAGAQFLLTSTPAPSEGDPSVTVGGEAALVAWTSNAGSQSNIGARRVLESGAVLDASELLVSGAANAQVQAAAAWDGNQFVVGFTDFRNDPANSQPVGDLYAARVSSAGMVLDPDAFAVANVLADPELDPACAGGAGLAALGGAIFRVEAPYAAYRVGHRMLLPAGVLSAGDPPAPSNGIRVMPNPSRETVEISFAKGAGGPIAAGVYDMQGREVSPLETATAGSDRVSLTWDGRDASGSAVAPGIYFVKVRSAEGNRIAKLVRYR